MHSSQRYPIPETRLPFINAEIAQLNIKSEPFLVSSAWAGCLAFWNPQTEEHFLRQLPQSIPGAYMLKTGPDGALYLGCGNGDLLRFNGDDNDFEILVKGHMRGLCWGGAVTERHAFWNAHYGDCDGSVAVYDLKTGKVVHTFAPLDTQTPTGLYGHQTAVMPDGKILWHLDVPHARMVVIDPGKMTRVSLERSWLDSSKATRSALLNDRQLAVFTADAAYRVSYPDFEVTENLKAPDSCLAGGRKCPVVISGHLYCVAADNGDLWQMNLDTGVWRRLIDRWAGEEPVILGKWHNRDVCALTVSGKALLYEPDSDRSSTLDLEATGKLRAHALCAVPEKQLIIGAPFINQRFWTIDMRTGRCETSRG